MHFLLINSFKIMNTSESIAIHIFISASDVAFNNKCLSVFLEAKIIESPNLNFKGFGFYLTVQKFWMLSIGFICACFRDVSRCDERYFYFTNRLFKKKYRYCQLAKHLQNIITNIIIFGDVVWVPLRQPFSKTRDHCVNNYKSPTN